MAHAGLTPPTGPPPDSEEAANLLETLRARAQAGAEPGSEEDTLKLLLELTEAMAVLASLVQQAAALDDLDDAWNLVATCLDVVALRRLREHSPHALAILQALHLISDDRLLIADVIRARSDWGRFLLGHPADEDAEADNWSIIIGAVFAVLGAFIPFEDDKGNDWSWDMLFGWDPAPSDEHPRATAVLQRMATLVLTHRDGALEEHVGLSAVVVPPADGGWGLYVALDLGTTLTLPIGAHLELVFEADSPDAMEVFTGSNIVPSFFQPSAAATSARIALQRKHELTETWMIGAEDSSHLEIGTFLLALELGRESRARLTVGDAALVLPQRSLGLLGSLLPSGGATLRFDLDVIADSHGVAFAGGAGMTVTTPVNRSIAGLTVRSVTVAVGVQSVDGSAALAVSAVGAFSLSFFGAFGVSVDQLGVRWAWGLPPSPTEPDAGPIVPGNLGPHGNVDLDFVAPRGIGITVNIGSLHGGGFLFLDERHGTYGGALEMAFRVCGINVQLKAAGLLRETDRGWAFVVIVSGEFDPAIELFGTGILLTGVGGLAGINVGISIEALRTGLHDGSVGRLLFPADPVANAPAIVETMKAAFPPRDGAWVAGPLLQLGWGRPKPYLTLSAAIVLAKPSPTLIAILGRLRLTAPRPDAALVDIKADFIGVISLEEPSVAFDASLVDSRVTGYALTGDLALRLGPSGFILAVGGFHPRFTPPAGVPKLRRIALDISANAATKIRTESYLAVTSNTFQIGLHARLDIDAGPASIHGWLDFDALVAWEPRFSLSVRLDIGLELRVGGRTIAGVDVDLLLEGPGPWHAKGSAALHFFFFTLHARFETTWGEVESTAPPPEVTANSVVAEALSQPGAWIAVGPPSGTVVAFRAVEREEIGVHPHGHLSVRQQAVPLGVPITRIGRSHVTGGQAAVVVTALPGAAPAEPTIGRFAAAQFMDLDDDQKLSRPSFEPFQDGIEFGGARIDVSEAQVASASYETVFIPEGRRHSGSFALGILLHALEVGAVARSDRHRARLFDGADQRIRVHGPAYRVAVADTLATSPGSLPAYSSATEAHAAAAAASGRVVVVETHEAVA